MSWAPLLPRRNGSHALVHRNERLERSNTLRPSQIPDDDSALVLRKRAEKFSVRICCLCPKLSIRPQNRPRTFCIAFAFGRGAGLCACGARTRSSEKSIENKCEKNAPSRSRLSPSAPTRYRNLPRAPLQSRDLRASRCLGRLSCLGEMVAMRLCTEMNA